MKKIALFIAALAGMVATAQAQDKVLLTIDGDPVMQSEFLYIYNKNNQETTIDQKSIDEYLDLFINFKLKVKEAEMQGIDTTAAFKKELASYRKQATPKYLRDSVAEEEMMLLTYEHMKTDRRVAHIAIECPGGSSEEEEKAALALINDARVRVTVGKEKQVKKGKKMVTVPGEKEDFFAVADEVSTDRSVKENHGELGWVIPFRFIWSFEKAVYETNVGEVSEVFRSPYGFHIVLVEEEVPHTEVFARHIMKMAPGTSDSIQMEAKAITVGLHSQVVNGGDFESIAKANSDDKSSAMNGGSLGWFGRGRMLKSFEDEAFRAKPGQVSEPFSTRYGWHFLRVDSVRGIQPYSTIRASIQQQMKNNDRYADVQAKHIKNVRAEYNLPAEMNDEDVLAYEDANLENKYADLRNLVREYHDGILLFDVSLKEVWDKASLDTVGITNYFKQHKKDFKWTEPRYKGRIVFCKDQNTMKAAKQIIKHAAKDSVDSYLQNRLNQDSVIYVRTVRGLWKKGQKPEVDKYVFKAGEYEPTEEFPYVFVAGKKIKNPEEYMDERGKVTSAYQDYLEAEWVKQLRAKYEVVVNQEALEELRNK